MWPGLVSHLLSLCGLHTQVVPRFVGDGVKFCLSRSPKGAREPTMPSGKGARERRREARLALQMEWAVRRPPKICLCKSARHLLVRRIGAGAHAAFAIHLAGNARRRAAGWSGWCGREGGCQRQACGLPGGARTVDAAASQVGVVESEAELLPCLEEFAPRGWTVLVLTLLAPFGCTCAYACACAHDLSNTCPLALWTLQPGSARSGARRARSFCCRSSQKPEVPVVVYI